MNTRTRRSVALLTALALAVPAAVGTSAAVAAQDDDAQFCKDTNIVFFPGGPEGGGFATVVYNGAKAAEALFGPNVDYQWSDWDPGKMITQFSEAVATGPDGIAVMGHPGDDAFKPLIDDAIAQGIVVTVMNTELPATQEEHASPGHRLRRRHPLQGRLRPGQGSHPARRPGRGRPGLRLGSAEPGWSR